jgi:universal stress protein E
MATPPSPRRRIRLLVVVDPAAVVQPALEKAVRLARALSGTLEVYACDWREGLDPGPRGVAALRRPYVEAGDRRLRDLVQQAWPGARRCGVRYEFGHPRVDRILAHVRRVRPDLVVIDAHFHAAARRTLFGPADWPLIRDCPAPILYAKPNRWHVAPRVAAAVDPLHPAEPTVGLDARLVDAARRLARGLRGSLHVIHAWLPLDPGLGGPGPLGIGMADPAVSDRLVAAAEARAGAAVRLLVRPAGQPRAQIELLRGAAVETIPGFAEVEGLDILAVGAVSRGRLQDLIIGATAERLLERVPCDLLVLKPARPVRRPKAAARRRVSRYSRG